MRRLVRKFVTLATAGGFVLRRLWLLLASPGVRLGGDAQRIAWSAITRASDGGRVVVGARVQLSRGVEIVAQRGVVTLGDDVFIGPWSTFTAKAGISVGRHVLVAERVTVRDQNHAIHGTEGLPIAHAGFDVAPVVIGDDAWIGAGAVILAGVRIGNGAVVAANAVVTREVAPHEIVGGVPARHLGWRRARQGSA